MTHASLFSGVGGFDLAAEWAGWTNMFNCEIDAFCRRVLDGITFPRWRIQSIKAYGNAIVPQVFYQIAETINEYERS